MQIRFRAPTAADVTAIAARMRPADAAEVWASHHLTPAEALRYSWEQSELAWTATAYGLPIAMFGAVRPTLISDSAVIWFLGTTDIDRMRYRFIRESQRVIAYFLTRYRQLENWVDARNEETIRWLSWLGAEIGEPAPYGAEQIPFRHFVLRRMRHVHCGR